MQIINLKTGEPFPLLDCGLCLGNFDGVHLGHKALVKELIRLNSLRRDRLPLGALLFSKPPSAYLQGKAVPQLTTFEEKLRLLQREGLQFAVIVDFPDLMNLSPDDFVREILIQQCHCRIAVCGFNYSYGSRGAGSPEDLVRTFGSQPDRTVGVVPPVTDGKDTVSSTAVRKQLAAGHPEDATRMLGHPFTLIGKVTEGRHVGTVMGYPTANLTFPDGLLVPAHGVYLTSIKIGRRSFFGISNVGIRPTFEDDSEAVNCETFLFDFKGNLYDKTMQVSFLRFLRAERKFADRQALTDQIKRDIERAKSYI
jgi:riboflavin kinase/FMN adenylyltransferase